jgi:hypothetical protein
MTIVKAKNNTTGEVRDFSTADWYNYNKTGDWTMLSTRIVAEPVALSRSLQPPQVAVKAKGCGCGKKK